MSDYSTLEETAGARERLDDLLGLSEGLTQWEMNIIEDLSHWDGRFTKRQIETITRLYTELV